MRKMISLIAFVALAGCAPTIWDKVGGSQEQFNIDSAGCRLLTSGSGGQTIAIGSPRFVAAATLIGSLASAAREVGNYRDCMMMRGYVPRQ